MTASAYSSFPIPDLRAVLMQLKDEVFTTFNCHQLGTIESFDPAKQTASVSINVLRSVPNLDVNPPVYKTISYPLLVDVPVFINSGGSGYLTFPIAKGDTCLVLFNDRDIDSWFSTGVVAEPNSSRLHDLSDGLALVGFRSLANVLESFDTENAVVAYDGGKVRVGSKIDILNALTTMTVVLGKLHTALVALNGKTGPTAATQIADFQTEYLKLFKP